MFSNIFGLKPLDSIFSPSLSAESLEDITITTLQEDARGSIRKPSTGKNPEIEYGERAPNLRYIAEKSRHFYRMRGSPDLTVSHYATHTLRALNRQDWARASTYYQRLKQSDGRLFYDADLYSRFLEEVGFVIAQRNPNYRFYWIKDPNGQFIIGYEVKKPKDRTRTISKSLDIESNGQPPYVNSFVRRKFKKSNSAHKSGSNGNSHLRATGNELKQLHQPHAELSRALAARRF